MLSIVPGSFIFELAPSSLPLMHLSSRNEDKQGSHDTQEILDIFH